MNFKILLLLCSLFISQIGLSQHDLMGLIPVTTATHTAIQSGDWFSEATWDVGTVPSDAAIVVIPQGITVTYEGNSGARIFAIRVDGEFLCTQTNPNEITRLRFDTFIGTHHSKVKFIANTSNHGKLDILITPFNIETHKEGTSGFSQIWNQAALDHFSDKATTYEVTYEVGPDKRFDSYQAALAGNTTVTETSRTTINDVAGVLGRYLWDSTQLSLGVVTMGELEIIGQEKDVMAKLSADALKNQSQIVLNQIPSGWQVGDKIVITAGGNKAAPSNGTETAIIGDISGNTITTTTDLLFNHEGRPQDDLHCYVGDLNRNIRFFSTNTNRITNRGHLMAMHNPTNVQIRNAEFLDMGRTDKSRLVDDLVWQNWLEPKVFKSKISPLGQECSQLKLNPKEDITNMRGRYSIHIHKTGAAHGANLTQITGNVVSGNPGWGITHHDAHANVSNNLVYDVVGAGIVSEAGSETGFWDHNLVVKIASGHDFDPYLASLFYDDYLYRGEGLGLKGRSVICRNNVIADTNRGVGVVNFNAAVNSLVRVDAAALAAVRPGFEIDQFPLSQHGYSKEGDGVMPLEVALIMENTTVIHSSTALRSIERDMGLNHESRSIFDGFIAWGTVFGLQMTYQADYSFKDLFISGKNNNSKGIDMWKHSHNHSYERVKLVDLDYAVTASKLVEGNDGLKTRNNGFTPWIFIDLEVENVNTFYRIEPEDPASTVIYDEHPDNPIFLNTNDLPTTRPMTFTLNDSADLVIDLATNDLQFKIDGAINDRTGTYEYGVKQALAQGELRLDYPERIYEFASAEKLTEYLEANGLYQDVNDNNQLYFIINEIIVDRTTFEKKTFPIRIKILNAPNTGIYANPQIEDPANLLPQNQLLSRAGVASQKSTRSGLEFQGIPIDPDAAKAIDGNNNGRLNVNFYQRGLLPVGSTAMTKREFEPWWDLDLGEQKIIEYIDIWSPMEMHGVERETPSTYFHNFYVLISDTPFGDLGLDDARAMADYEYLNGQVVKQLFSLNDLNAHGRYIRVQAIGEGRVGIAEIDVIGRDFSNVADCHGDVNGLAYVDNCGTCVGGNTNVEPCERDCHNEFGGTAYFDNCGICVGGNTGISTAVEIPCNGIDDDCNTATSDAGPISTNVQFQNESIMTGIYTAQQTITTNQNVTVASSENVALVAGTAIDLNADFSVELGGEFYAQIANFDNCLVENETPITALDAACTDEYISTCSVKQRTELSVYPNPFFGQTTVEFYLPKSMEVSLQIYHANGQFLQNIVQPRTYPAGMNTINFSDSMLKSGIYFFVLKTEKDVVNEKVVLISD